MRVVQLGTFHTVSTPLNLSRERGLYADYDALINHLNRLLLAGTLTTRSRQLLNDYFTENQGEIDDERLLRDVIGLAVTSTEFAIQR